MSLKVAIVGSGPSGCYLAQALRKKAPNAELVIFDRLPVPYGLIRYGVAPDHQGTKGVIEQFDRLFTREGVTFVGNVDVGRDVSLEDIQSAFDVVVLATGVVSDRILGLPGEDSARVYRAGRVTRLFNGYPDESRDNFELGERVLIVGHGNVGLDIVRLLCKTGEDFVGSDIDDAFHENAVRSLREINIVGRRAAVDVRFDKTLVKELSRIEGVKFRMHGVPDEAPDKDAIERAKVESLRELEDVEPSSSPRVEVNFHFGWTPASLDERADGVTARFHPSDGSTEQLTITADSVITAVGFAAGERDRWSRDALRSPSSDVVRGKLADGLFCTGWFGKGAHGTIPEHRTESKGLASTILDEWGEITVGSEKTGLVALAAQLEGAFVDFDGWKAIDSVERASASEGRFRRKLITTEGLLKVARDSAAEVNP